MHQSTLDDIKQLAKTLGVSQGEAIRYLLHRGFISLGDWRNSYCVIINGKRELIRWKDNPPPKQS